MFEVPISYLGRTYQEGKKIGLRDAFLALRAIVRFWLIDDLYAEDEYGAAHPPQPRAGAPLQPLDGRAVRPHVGARVLEIGAGIGNITGWLLPRDRYLASDINPHYVDYLRSLPPESPIWTSRASTSALGASRRLRGQFDTVVCLNVLEHVRDPVAALGTCVRPGARRPAGALRAPGPGALSASTSPRPPLPLHPRRSSRARRGGLNPPRAPRLQPAGPPGLVVERGVLAAGIRPRPAQALRPPVPLPRSCRPCSPPAGAGADRGGAAGGSRGSAELDSAPPCPGCRSSSPPTTSGPPSASCCAGWRRRRCRRGRAGGVGGRRRLGRRHAASCSASCPPPATDRVPAARARGQPGQGGGAAHGLRRGHGRRRADPGRRPGVRPRATTRPARSRSSRARPTWSSARASSAAAHRVLFFWHYVGNRLLTLLSNMLTNLNLTDMETCYKVFRREVLRRPRAAREPLRRRARDDRQGGPPRGARIYEVPDQLLRPRLRRGQEDRLARRLRRHLGHPPL